MKITHKRLSSGKAMLLSSLPLMIALLLHKPIVSFAAQLCTNLGLENFAHSFQQLLTVLEGGTAGEDSRLAYYQVALRGFMRSPLTGSMLGGETAIGSHSDVLDLLSGMGILGSTAVCLLLWGAVRPLFLAVHRSDSAVRAHLRLSAAAVFVTALFGTVIYSRDITAVTSFGFLLAAGNISTPAQDLPDAPEDGKRSNSQNLRETEK